LTISFAMKYPGAALPPDKNVRSPNASLWIAFEPEMQIGSDAANSSRFGSSKSHEAKALVRFWCYG